MPALNKIQLIGNLGRAPETRFTPSGKKVCQFSLGVNGRADQPEWFQVEAWERLAEVCQEYLAKGALVYVEGRVQTDKWTDQAGQAHSRMKVVASQMQMLGTKRQADEPAEIVVEDDEM